MPGPARGGAPRLVHVDADDERHRQQHRRQQRRDRVRLRAPPGVEAGRPHDRRRPATPSGSSTPAATAEERGERRAEHEDGERQERRAGRARRTPATSCFWTGTPVRWSAAPSRVSSPRARGARAMSLRAVLASPGGPRARARGRPSADRPRRASRSGPGCGRAAAAARAPASGASHGGADEPARLGAGLAGHQLLGRREAPHAAHAVERGRARLVSASIWRSPGPVEERGPRERSAGSSSLPNVAWNCGVDRGAARRRRRSATRCRARARGAPRGRRGRRSLSRPRSRRPRPRDGAQDIVRIGVGDRAERSQAVDVGLGDVEGIGQDEAHVAEGVVVPSASVASARALGRREAAVALVALERRRR